MGGKENKLRYFFIITSTTGISFTESQNDLIKHNFLIVAEKFNSELETINFEKNYSRLKILVPLDVAIGNVIEKGINECNKYDNFIFKYYYVTNEKIPVKQEIEEYIKEIKGI